MTISTSTAARAFSTDVIKHLLILATRGVRAHAGAHFIFIILERSLWESSSGTLAGGGGQKKKKRVALERGGMCNWVRVNQNQLIKICVDQLSTDLQDRLF